MLKFILFSLMAATAWAGIGDEPWQIEQKTGVYERSADNWRGDNEYIHWHSGGTHYMVQFFKGRSVLEVIGNEDGGLLDSQDVLKVVYTYGDSWTPYIEPALPEMRCVKSGDGQVGIGIGSFVPGGHGQQLAIYDIHYLESVSQSKL